MRIRLLALLILFSTLLAIPVELCTQGVADPRLDCAYLLWLLELSLRDLNQIRRVDETVLPHLFNASPAIPVELSILYNRSVTQLYSLGLVITALHYGLELVPRDSVTLLLNTLQEDLPDTLNTFTARLSSCSHDPALAATYRVRIRLELEKLFSSTIPRVVNESFRELLLNPDIFYGETKEVYRPGEAIRLRVMVSDTTGAEVVVVSWPTLKVVSRLTPEATDGGMFVHFSVPSLKEARFLNLPLVRVGGEYHLKLAILLREGGVVRAGLPISVKYEPPHLTIDCPQIVAFNEVLTIKVNSAGYYNATIRVDGKPILNTTIQPGSNIYMLEPGMLNYSRGLLSVSIKVFEGEGTVGREYLCGVLVEFPVAIQVAIPELVLTASGSIEATLLVRNRSNQGYLLLIKAGGYTLPLVSSHCTEGCSLKIPSGAMPIAPLRIQVILALGDGVPLYEKEVAVVNISMLLLLALLLVLASPLLSRIEVGIALFLPRLPRGAEPRNGAEENQLPTGFTRIKSRVATLYLRVLRRLRIPLPSPSETLREHFYYRVAPLLKLRDVLWRMLRLAEQDLYSRSKPRYEDALELLRKVEEHGH